MRPVIGFDGSVSTHRGCGAVGWSLRGQSRSATLELLFSGVAQIAPALPPTLHSVRVIELAADTAVAAPLSQTAVRSEHLFRIEASEGEYLVRARGVQLHAEASAAFFAVLPPTRVAPVTRWGWSLLLSLLRVRPLVRLIGKRGA